MAEPSHEEQPTRTVELLWGLRAASTRGPKATLNVENIAAAAVAVADTDGIERGLDAARRGETSPSRRCPSTAMSPARPT